jgi:hypothetical protein
MDGVFMVNGFVRGATYRHDTSGDLDMRVVAVSYFDETRFKLKVHWVSKSTGTVVVFPGQQLNGTSNIEIQRSDLLYWSRLK